MYNLAHAHRESVFNFNLFILVVFEKRRELNEIYKRFCNFEPSGGVFLV